MPGRHASCVVVVERREIHSSRLIPLITPTKETIMQWTKPEYTDLRFGFEITMYILNR